MKVLKAAALMAVLLASAVLMLGVLSMRGLPARGGSIPGATLNGDVNCDGTVDLSDAISIIQYQFYGGMPLCALAQDNFATKDELTALTARVAAIENSSKKAASAATGTFIGDGQQSRQINTGLSGKLREVRIYLSDPTSATRYYDLGASGANGRIDAMSQEGATINQLIFSGPDFITGGGLNFAGSKYAWIAISSPE
jgi:hypothetical protein